MDRATDCERALPVEWLPDMPDFAELKLRIDSLCARTRAEHPDARLLVEIEDLLAEGYMCALRGDHRSRRLQRRFEDLVDAESARCAQELQDVAREQRMVSEATKELRSQLAIMREHWVEIG